MKFIFRLLFLILIKIIFINASLNACKYTVREIGLTELGSTPYRLCFFYDNSAPREITEAFEQITFAALLETNVQSEMINIDQQNQHPAMKYFRSLKIDRLPAVILIDSDEKMMVCPFEFTSENYKEPIWQLIEKIVLSNFRKEILESTISDYGIVLLLEGKCESQNEHAKQAIDAAIQAVSKMLKMMPKPIKHPPKILTMRNNQWQSEKILLWSVGIDSLVSEAPTAAIFYGRGRRIGPTLNGEDVNRTNVLNLLALIGADCECGLDRSFFLGKTFPLRWGKKWQSILVKKLGFDIESPIVLSEMSQILSLAPSFQGMNKKFNPLTAYTEGFVKYENSDDEDNQTNANSGKIEFKTDANKFFTFPAALAWSGFFLMLVLLIAAFIFICGKRRESE